MLDDLLEAQRAKRRGHNVVAVAQDRRPIRDSRDLVHAVRDVDDRHTFGFQAAKEVEQLVDLAARQRGRRLVEDEHLHVARDRLDDLRQLPLASGEVADYALADRCRRREPETARARALAAVASSMRPSESLLSLFRKMFCATVSVGTRLISWKIIPMPARFEASGLCSVSVRSVDLDLAGAWFVNAVQDLEDRRFAGAVLAEQRMNLATAHVEADIFQARGRRRNSWTRRSAEPRRTMVCCHRPWHWFSRLSTELVSLRPILRPKRWPGAVALAGPRERKGRSASA